MYLLSFFREIFNQTFLWYVPTTCAHYMFPNRINTTTALSCPDTQWFQLLDLHDLLKYNFVATKYCTFSAVEIRKFHSKIRRYIFGFLFLPWSTSYNSAIFELKVPVCVIYKISFYLSSQFSLIYLFLFAPRTRFCCHFYNISVFLGVFYLRAHMYSCSFPLHYLLIYQGPRM